MRSSRFLRDVCRAQCRILLSVPSNRLALISILLIRVVFALMMASLPVPEIASKGAELMDMILLSGVLTSRMAILLGVVFAVSDFRYGSIDFSVGWVSRRWHLMTAKCLIASLVVLACEFVGTALAVAGALLVLRGRGLELPFESGVTWPSVVANVVASLVCVNFGIVIGWISRRLLPGVLIGLGWPLVESLLNAVLSQVGVDLKYWFPLTATFGLRNSSTYLLDPSANLQWVVVLVFLASTMVFGCLSSRRDIRAAYD